MRHRAAGARGERDEGVLNVALVHPRSANVRLTTPFVLNRTLGAGACASAALRTGAGTAPTIPPPARARPSMRESRHAIGTES